MSGLYGIFSKNKDIPKENYKMFFSSKLGWMLSEEHRYNKFVYGRSVRNKFLDDRTLFENERYIICFEGIFYNKITKPSVDTILLWYEKKGMGFIEDIDGVFSGFIFDKHIDKIYVFNDHLATRPVYYYFNKKERLFIFSSEMKMISSLTAKLNSGINYDLDGIYSLLLFGNMFDDLTIVKEIRRLLYGSVLEFDLKTFEISQRQYFEFPKNKNHSQTKKQIIEAIDELMNRAVGKEWEKDIEYGYKHYAFLSGGLDSRTNVLLARELGYHDMLTITFAQSNSRDHVIAREVSSVNHIEHIFRALDNGNYLIDIMYDNILSTDGLINFTGSGHVLSSLQLLEHNDFGLMHTGQIGDAILGSSVRKNFNIGEQIYKLCCSGPLKKNKRFTSKISFVDELIERYKNNSNQELYFYEQYVINGALSGDRSISNYCDPVSPFYDKNLIAYCLTIPDKFRLNEAIYIEWLNAKHPAFTKHKWAKVNARPTSVRKVTVAKEFNRYKNKLLRTLGFETDNMNPFSLWIKNNEKIEKTLDSVYHDNIGKISNKELRNDIQAIYNSHENADLSHKFSVITTLLSLDLHFNQGNYFKISGELNANFLTNYLDNNKIKISLR